MSHDQINKDTIIQNMHQKLQYIPSKISTMCVNNIEQTLVVDSGMETDTLIQHMVELLQKKLQMM